MASGPTSTWAGACFASKLRSNVQAATQFTRSLDWLLDSIENTAKR
ncbi:MAG: hypothetical protein ACK5ZG_15530 [Phycisphaerae bacterium]